ncbi:uncharacterized protein LOC128186279 isoform X2 [Crassostrea angulata]|uniref:uncharacterized protein LOC128186279 isoform X2 n=1 Tax=Magallana angulata TaxID=2784310 RepID=UPI0022B19D75|nr:uncharacterized protein LOC128186279 isoform X2 [Crassostrea angulata]
MAPFRFFQKKLIVLILLVLLQCISVLNAQSSKEISTLSTQDVAESTLEITNGSSTITTILPPTTTAEIMIAADSSRCPVVILSPELIATHIGTSLTFKAVIYSYFDEALESRWSCLTGIIDINDPKFLGSKNIPFPELVVNNVTFEDDGVYEIQVRINDGWCTGNNVTLDTIGVLDLDDPCNSSKECDLLKNLVCSSLSQTCVCNNDSYHRNRACYLRTRLRAIFSSSKTSTTNITVWWNHPYQNADLVQSYNVSLRAYDSSYNFKTSVEMQTNYTFESSFLPGYLYFFEITSVVFFNDSEATIFVKTDTVNLVVDLLPPRPMDTNASFFHPQLLFLSLPEDNYNVDWYSILINGYWQMVNRREHYWPKHLEPGTNYTIRIEAYSWWSESYSRTSTYDGYIKTQRVPKVTFPSSEFSVPLLSKLEITATVHNISNIPLTTAVKWQKNDEDINITDTRFIGSTEDLTAPKLVISKVDFNNDHGQFYRCVATNSEGSWTASARIIVHEGFEFLESCNRSEQCSPGKHLTCRQSKCLCEYNYYHYNYTCFYRYDLRENLYIDIDTCKGTLRWSHSPNDHDLRIEHFIFRRSVQNNRWVYEDTTSVGIVTQYTFSQCILQPGRLYNFYIRSNVLLTNPNETFHIYSNSRTVIMELLPPGQIDRKRSTFSPNQLMLRWERSGQNTFLNHYRVEIDGHQQKTFGSIPKIYWTKHLTPGARYNVTITAVSYGHLSSRDFRYGIKESKPYVDWIETDTGDKEGYSYLSFGQRDNLLRGDDKTSAALKSPITIYAGDVLEEGFNFVRIGSNGVIGLGEEFNRISIHDINSKQLKNRHIVCPFWSDLKDDDGYIYYKTYQRGVDAENDLFLGKASKIVNIQFADFPDFKASWLVKATWVNMTLFGATSKTITFQWLLITDGQSTFTVFNYIDVNLESIKNRKITIGYQYEKTSMKNQYSNTKRAFKMSENPGNRGVNGFWIHKMTTGDPLNKNEKGCFDWYIKNKEENIYIQLTSFHNPILCPCNGILLRFDPRYAVSRFDTINQVLCYATMIVGRNTECCYRMLGSINNLGPLERSLPSAGTILQYNPFFERRLYTIEDLNAREACCIKTKQCNLFYEVRPIPLCYRRSPFNPALNFGDPHIVTLDGKNYTFNGYGEYTMLKISKDSIQFDLQARTDLATTANGTSINATIFSAFVALDQTGSKLQIEMSQDKTKMLVRVNDRDLTREFGNESYVSLNQNLSVRWENRTLAASFLQTSIILRVSLGVRFLISEVVVDNAYSGFAKGLMGNFDGNATNEFILPNGTLLDENATNTERDLYFNFGQKWLVNEDSLFYYEKGLSYQNYSHLEFQPLFLDEVDRIKLDDAKTKCGSNISQACIFDYLATGDIALAESSGLEEASAHTDIKILENESPIITGNSSINVEIGKTVYMQFNAYDDSTKLPKYNLLKQPERFSLNETTGIANWTPTSTAVSELSISVIDDVGAESPSIDVSIVLCKGCGSNGRCSYDNIIPSENDRYSWAVCVCDIGYSGENCEMDTNACLNEPCPLQRNCTDLTPEEEIRFGRGYNCTDCPMGYNDVNDKCEDINECEGNSSKVCNTFIEHCENTEGSYQCICLSGFRKHNGTCKDIDECSEKTSGCEQICNNTYGSFECLCFPGFSLNSNNATCSRTDENSCDSIQRSCEYTCDPIEKKCLCPIGFQLAEDGQGCQDVNECDLQPPKCLQECYNTNGSFQCDCRPGFKLNEDKISCSECEEPYFGEDCSQICTCGQGMERCDPVTGCFCKRGWTGTNCTVDINECENDQGICGNEKVCQNLKGSYTCNCKEGFQKNGDSCDDIDECSDITLNTCSVDTNCQNLYGNYTCNCKPGFQKYDSGCEDIDECQRGIADCQQICINTIGGFNCGCEFGYTLDDVDRKTCGIVRDVCAQFPQLNCSYGCRFGERDPYKGYCFCESGFELDFDKSTCKDIVECNESSTCQHNCTNIQGSFECVCTTGYSLEKDGRSCKDIDECLGDSHCEHYCNNTDGSYVCSCRDGFNVLNFSKCEDIDECSTIDTGIDGCKNCTNIPGSFRCSCSKGYVLNSTTLTNCHNIDECKEQTADCALNATCSDTDGGYTCTCRSGFEGDGKTCTVCPNFKYGVNCSNDCECVFNNTKMCDHVTGECECSVGWTRTDCSEDIDECQNGSISCNESIFQVCVNTEGLAHCECQYGGSDISNCVPPEPSVATTQEQPKTTTPQQPESTTSEQPESTICENFKYGDNCSNDCACVLNNTNSCHNVTGTCDCKKEWTGTDCSEDIDECKNGLISCNESIHQVCINTDGSAHCECRYGGTDISNCIAPKPPGIASTDEFKVKAEIAFDFDHRRENILQNTDKWIVEITSQLETFYRKHVQDFTRVVFLSLRFGSVIVEHEIYSSGTEETLKVDTANSMVKLLRQDEKIVLFNRNTEVKNIILFKDNITININSTINPCLIYADVCSKGKTCIDSSGVASCVNSNTKGWTLFIIIGIVVPLGMAIIVLAVVYVCQKGRSKKKSKRSITLDNNGVNDNKDDTSRGYWNSIDDLLNQQKQFRIKRPATLY